MNDASGIINCFLLVGVPLVLFIVSFWRLKRSNGLSKLSRSIWMIVRAVSFIPLLCFLLILLFFVVANFPFTSNIAAHGSAPTGEEACVIQTFEGIDGYAVSLYARAQGGPWTRHPLSYEDGHWWNCHIEFKNGNLFVYESSELRKMLSIKEATAPPEYPSAQLPANLTPEQILARHNAKF